MNKKFSQHRKWFKNFKIKFEKNGEVENEFVRAIDKLVAEYDTAIYENRFVVGGAVEFLFVALVRALGFNVGHVGTSEKRGDFEVEGLRFSLKTNFTGKGEIRLINKLGQDVNVTWDEATIFIISGLGIIYADPDLLTTGIVDKGDALVVSAENLKSFIEKQDDFWIKVQIPYKPNAVISSRIASFDIAIAILEETKSKILIKFLSKK